MVCSKTQLGRCLLTTRSVDGRTDPRLLVVDVADEGLVSVGLSKGLPVVLVASGLPGVVFVVVVVGLFDSPGGGAIGEMGGGASPYDSINCRNGSQAYRAWRTELQ